MFSFRRVAMVIMSLYSSRNPKTPCNVCLSQTRSRHHWIQLASWLKSPIFWNFAKCLWYWLSFYNNLLGIVLFILCIRNWRVSLGHRTYHWKISSAPKCMLIPLYSKVSKTTKCSNKQKHTSLKWLDLFVYEIRRKWQAFSYILPWQS